MPKRLRRRSWVRRMFVKPQPIISKIMQRQCAGGKIIQRYGRRHADLGIVKPWIVLITRLHNGCFIFNSGTFSRAIVLPGNISVGCGPVAVFRIGIGPLYQPISSPIRSQLLPDSRIASGFSSHVSKHRAYGRIAPSIVAECLYNDCSVVVCLIQRQIPVTAYPAHIIRRRSRTRRAGLFRQAPAACKGPVNVLRPTGYIRESCSAAGSHRAACRGLRCHHR